MTQGDIGRKMSTDTGRATRSPHTANASLAGRVLLCLLIHIALCVGLASCLTTCGTAQTVDAPMTLRDVAGDLKLTFEQQTGLPPGVVAKLIICAIGWALAFASFGWLMRPPQSMRAKIVILSIIIFLAVGLPILLFVFVNVG